MNEGAHRLGTTTSQAREMQAQSTLSITLARNLTKEHRRHNMGRAIIADR